MAIPFITGKRQKEKKIPIYRNKEERKEEVKILINKLAELQISSEYDAIKQFYKLLAKYISDGERIIVNIPFPEISKRIEGILPVNKLEEVTIRLKNEKY